jgi:3-phosphoshikimate 1-carboxyvinyltransferase
MSLDQVLNGVTFVAPASSIAGHIAVPGDKSISHRAVLLAAISEGETRISGFGRSADTEATIAAVRALGAKVEEEEVDILSVRGVGLRGLAQPAGPIDCGNSGTLMRLVAGILAGQEGRRFELTGDESLNSRPMERIAEPLRQMGAHVETTDGHAPLLIEGAELTAIRYELPVASAQVKSCLLLAGLCARGRTRVVQPLATRDHTERLLSAAGAVVRRRGTAITIAPVERLALGSVDVPGDVSSAAPFVVAATLLAGSELTVHGVGLNPTRTGFIDLLAHMGARITVVNRGRLGPEPAGDLDVRHAELVAATVGPEQVPGLVDELPLFALAAGCARGESVVSGAGELRAKETDRIETVTNALRTLGIRIAASDDGFGVRGVPTRPKGGGVDSGGDHRIAMLGGTAGVVSREGVRVGGAEAVAVSFPGFFDLLDEVARRP